jgi:hypothetical protein
MSRLRRSVACTALGTLLAMDTAGPIGTPPPYVPRDARLRAMPVYLYPSAEAGRAPRAVVVFLGNDLGFWAPHRRLSERLALGGYDVVGVDVKRLLATLPESSPCARERAFAALLDTIVVRARHELGADSAPLVLAGHSFGAELALWSAVYARPAGTLGVLAMSPGMRGHLCVTLGDMLEREPTELGSFSVSAMVGALPIRVRVALVRGAHDRLRASDSAFAAAGASRVREYEVPFAGHSLKSLMLTGPVVERALGFVAGGSGKPRPYPARVALPSCRRG